MSAVAALAVCIGCGSQHTCEPGCSWRRVDRSQALGVCSECPTHVGRFVAGDRQLTTEARLEEDMRKVFAS